MRVDFEAAWHQLQAEIAEDGHPQRGQRWLLQRMSKLAIEHQVSESLIERAARIHGLPRLIQAIPEDEPSAEPDSTRAGTTAPSGHRSTEGGHDGSSTNGVAPASD